MYAIHVHPSVQASGLGARLLLEACSVLQDLGFARVRLWGSKETREPRASTGGTVGNWPTACAERRMWTARPCPRSPTRRTWATADPTIPLSDRAGTGQRPPATRMLAPVT